MNKIFYILGKSASGKDHIYQALLGDPELSGRLEPLVIYTTRPRREGEQNGREYFFTDEEGLSRYRSSGRVIEERCYITMNGPWYYFTVDDGRTNLSEHSYLGIGTLESYVKLADYFGNGKVDPLYIETDDGIRIRRALRREEKQERPDYEEMCRRYLADEKDFSEENLRRAGITTAFSNNGELSDCVGQLARHINNMIK